MDKEKQIIDYIKQYVPLDNREEDIFLRKVSYATFKKGQFVLRKDDINKYQNFILEGCFKTYQIDPTGKESILTFSIENWWSGDLYSFLSEQPTQYFIEALEDTAVLRITKQNLEEVYKEIPQINVMFRVLLERAFIAQQERIMGNISESAEEKYLKLRKKYPAFEQRIPLKQLALYLGITPQFLSMVRNKISRKSISSSS